MYFWFCLKSVVLYRSKYRFKTDQKTQNYKVIKIKLIRQFIPNQEIFVGLKLLIYYYVTKHYNNYLLIKIKQF